MNLPNKLTISRIILAFVFMLFLFSRGTAAKTIALLVFAFASLTDYLDGRIARETGQITNFGKLMDPIADKILVLAAFMAFVEMRIIPAWMVVIIIFREVAITGLRIAALTKNRVIPSDDGGRHKTVSQMLAIFAILLFIIFKEGGTAVFGFWDKGAQALYKNAIFILMLITVILTLTSGISYLVKNREVYANEKAD
jgi:CDP-diacylglycerol--glycerol-3-phosphate 3-phosphatidyltransferase